MKKIKYFIIILGFIAIILIISLLTYKTVKKNNDIIDNLTEIEIPKSINNIGYNEFFSVSNCISTFLSILDMNNIKYYERTDDGYKFVATNKQIENNLISLMSDRYKKNQNVDNSSILSKIKMQKESEMLTLTQIEKLSEGKVNSYLAYGFTSNNKNEFIRDICCIVNLDYGNKTFSIEQLSESVDAKDITAESIENIEKNSYNKFVDHEIKIINVVNRYINDFKTMMIVKPDIAYELLDKDYREKRFGSYNNFKEYINSNKDEIQTLSAEKYRTNYNDGSKEYIILDKNGKYYRFCEDSALNYTVMLDTYTIDLPQFVEQYSKASDEQKVMLNLEKFIQMINSKDYVAAYGLLDETYREKNFSNGNDFIKYIQDNFNRYNTLEKVENITKEGKYYTCTALISNTKFINNEPIERRFVISLEDGTSFKMAINLD